LGFVWKNIENIFCYDHFNNWRFKTPLARTAFTSLGRSLYIILNKIVDDYKRNPKSHNPCTTLETFFDPHEENLVQSMTAVHKPIETNRQLQAIEIVVQAMRKYDWVINRDGTVWIKIKESKMTYKDSGMDIEALMGRIMLTLAENVELVQTNAVHIKNALRDFGCDDLLCSPVPRIIASYHKQMFISSTNKTRLFVVLSGYFHR
jgi:hypothetical protein